MMGCFHIACRYQDPNNARIVTIQGKFTWTCFYFHLTRPDFFHTQRLFKGNCDEIFIYTIWKGILNERDFFINKTVWLTLNIGRRRTRTMHQTNQAGCPESGGCVSVCVDLLAWLLDVDCSLTLNYLTSVTKPKECYFSSINSSLRYGHQT